MKSNVLTQALLKKKIRLPKILSNLKAVHFTGTKPSSINKDVAASFKMTGKSPLLKLGKKKLKDTSAKRIGVVFSGGQAPGGHNVIAGLYTALKKINSKSKLFGFLNGPSGLLEKKYIEITGTKINQYRNLGGFDMIGSGRTKIEGEEALIQALKSSSELNLDGFIIIGGDDSNTNAAVLAEYFKRHNCKTVVVGVPKTIDGDLQNDHVEISFGYDTACKLYAELIGNIATDALSSQKYYHFIKLMGRAASHITLECALQVQPNMALISEEIKHKKLTLDDIVDKLVQMIIKRNSLGKNFGVILIPEGLIDFIPAFEILNKELNDLLAKDKHSDHHSVLKFLSEDSHSLFSSLPENIQKQLLLDRDPHGNIQLAKIDTQDLLIEMTEQKLKKIAFEGKFNPVSHYFGYEGRCAHPSIFDAEYTYALGHVAALLVQLGYTGYMASIKNLKKNVLNWEIYALPITSLLHLEHRHGKDKPVIKKALVNLKGKPFLAYQKYREKWLAADSYQNPGPIQYFGDSKICNERNFFLKLS